MNETTNYTEAFEELKKIVSAVEQKEISVDELAGKVKRALHLIRMCKAKLDNAEEDVHQIEKEVS